MYLGTYGHYFLFLVAVSSGSVFASSGDRSQVFQDCVNLCLTNQCQPTATHHPHPPLPLALRLTRWTCNDNCKYSCMHAITNRDVHQGEPVHQYYGKWPFWRFAGMQEPASVAFSLLNLWAHARGARKIRRRLPKSHPMRSYYLTWSFVSINAWIWSSVFHTRDVPTTEKFDYFSAALAILYALYYTVVRLFHLYPRRPRLALSTSQSTSLTHKLWTLLCIVAFIAHISYLSLLPRFDYAYNMAFNLIVGLTHNALWLVYAVPVSLIQRFPSEAKSYRPKYAYKAAVFVVLTTVATALELFDFPPWGRIIDAHALWHLSTAPIGLFWYDFLVEDALDSGWTAQR